MNNGIGSAKLISIQTKKTLTEVRRLAADIRNFTAGSRPEEATEKRVVASHVDALEEIRGEVEAVLSDLGYVANSLGVYDDKPQVAQAQRGDEYQSAKTAMGR